MELFLSLDTAGFARPRKFVSRRHAGQRYEEFKFNLGEIDLASSSLVLKKSLFEYLLS